MEAQAPLPQAGFLPPHQRQPVSAQPLNLADNVHRFNGQQLGGHGGGGRGGYHACYQPRRRSVSPPRDSGPRRAMSAFNETMCVRVGVLRPRKPVTRDQVRGEMLALHVASCVEEIFLEDAAGVHGDGGCVWVRVYFNTVDAADDCATKLCLPAHVSKEWRHCVTQRLPLRPAAPLGPPTAGQPRNVPCVAQPVEVVAVSVGDGFVGYSTDELYVTQRLLDWGLDKQRRGETTECVLCRLFDPTQPGITCPAGMACQFIHVQAARMERLLHTSPVAKHGHRHTSSTCGGSSGGGIVSAWDEARRGDTLIARDLDGDVGPTELRYMFGGCAGFVSAVLRATIPGRQYAVVRFDGAPAAMAALLQMHGADLSVSMYGAMEDMQAVQQRQEDALRAAGLTATAAATASPRAAPLPAVGGRKRGRTVVVPPPALTVTADGAAPVPLPPTLPFPALPDGWGHGEARHDGRYYFFHRRTHDSTRWTHPTDGKPYEVQERWH
jgi:hypothetical protein